MDLAALAESNDWLEPIGWKLEGSKLCWDADLVIGGERYEIRLIYPNLFPSAPPSVMPREAGERWSSHQYGASGELCLEYGPDNWESQITGAEMVSSAYRLLSGENKLEQGGDPLPSRDRFTLGQDLKGKKKRFFMTVEAQYRLTELPTPARVSGEAYLLWNKDSLVWIVRSLDLPSGRWDEVLPESFATTEFVRKVSLVRLKADFKMPPSTDVEIFRAVVEGLTGMEWASIDCFILAKDRQVEAYSISGDSITSLNVVMQRDSSSRLDENHSLLAGATVALVGCGSMGSKIATTLARSGVGSFVLIDQDIFLPENLVRNELDWRDVARHKVDALADRLHRVHPAVKTRIFRNELAGSAASEVHSHLLDVLSHSEVLIDASAEPNVFNALSAVVSRSHATLFWGELFAGGYGGTIARSRPDVDPDPQSIRTIIRNWCSEYGVPVYPAKGRYEGGEDTPFVADDSEVTILSSNLARFVLDFLLRPAESQYRHSVYMIGIGKGWIFEEPFQTIPLEVGGQVPSQDAPVSIEEQRAELLEVLRVTGEYADGIVDPGLNTAATSI